MLDRLNRISKQLIELVNLGNISVERSGLLHISHLLHTDFKNEMFELLASLGVDKQIDDLTMITANPRFKIQFTDTGVEVTMKSASVSIPIPPLSELLTSELNLRPDYELRGVIYAFFLSSPYYELLLISMCLRQMPSP
jgi:hypothetical protein